MVFQLASRPATPADKDFLFQLYAGTRMAEIAGFGWNEAQKQAFLTLQFTAQQRWYENAYPSAEQRVLLLESRAIGRTIVDRQMEAAILVDISLLPENRGQGIGTTVLRELLEQCRRYGVPFRLQVLRTNPAQRLYARLGFRKTGEDALYLQMEWRPDSSTTITPPGRPDSV
ncbi:MAG TPA: GNAT family N-acetyltransferase [Candidatus Angelobacter sp.]|nr:GNAT family N-acetyltransferase [Candidatus Angelobacter sp.]